jgi:EAL domain-containing protein (putative c-di-GMP-specific phosphodiesterase class I)
MLASAQSREIVSSSIQLAHTLGMDVVAEGIETEAVRNKLLELGCNYGQGWLFGRPAELKDISG